MGCVASTSTKVRYTPLSRQIFDPQSVRLASFLLVIMGDFTLPFGAGRLWARRQTGGPARKTICRVLPGSLANVSSGFLPVTPGPVTGGANTRRRVVYSPRLGEAGNSYRMSGIGAGRTGLPAVSANRAATLRHISHSAKAVSSTCGQRPPAAVRTKGNSQVSESSQATTNREYPSQIATKYTQPSASRLLGP